MTCRMRVWPIFVLGFFLLAVSIICFVLPPIVLQSQLRKILPILNDSQSIIFKRWLGNTSEAAENPVWAEFWLYNLTNQNEFVAGTEKAHYELVGPVTYRKTTWRSELQFTNDERYMSYRTGFTFVYDASKSVFCENDHIVHINPVVLNLIEKKRYTDLEALLTFNYKFTKKSMVKKWIWGYTDVTVSLLSKKDDSFIGLRTRFNNSMLPPVIAQTGKDNLENLGRNIAFNLSLSSSRIKRYLNESEWPSYVPMNIWSTDATNAVNGTDGTIFSAKVSSNRVLQVFSPEICRSLDFYYARSVVHRGIPGFEFRLDPATFLNATNNPENKGFCVDQSKCLDDGLLDISPCIQKQIPVFISRPYLVGAAKQYRDSMQIVRPSPKAFGSSHLSMTPDAAKQEDLDTSVTLEPITGIILKGKRNFQFNFRVSNPELKKYTNKYFPAGNQSFAYIPVFRLIEYGEMSAASAELLKAKLIRPLFAMRLTANLLVIAAFLVFCAGLSLVTGRLLKQRRAAVKREKLSPHVMFSDMKQLEKSGVAQLRPSAKEKEEMLNAPPAPPEEMQPLMSNGSTTTTKRNDASIVSPQNIEAKAQENDSSTSVSC